MKSKIILIVVFAMISCNSGRNKTGLAIQGMYVAAYQNEYTKGMDTIALIPINEDAGTFRYVRCMGYQRMAKGVSGPLQHRTETSTCVFNKNTAQLYEQRYGRIYSLSRDGNQLVCGSTTYKRM